MIISAGRVEAGSVYSIVVFSISIFGMQSHWSRVVRKGGTSNGF
jgi:hypothetical protein